MDSNSLAGFRPKCCVRHDLQEVVVVQEHNILDPGHSRPIRVGLSLEATKPMHRGPEVPRYENLKTHQRYQSVNQPNDPQARG